MMRKTIDLLNAKDQELVEAADWFRERDSWSIISRVGRTISRHSSLAIPCCNTGWHLPTAS